MTELKPCPFCGGKPYWNVLQKGVLSNSGRYECGCCGASRLEVFYSKSDAADDWNTRPSPWLTIEQAPRDGTEIILWGKAPHDEKPHAYNGWWTTEFDGYWERKGPYCAGDEVVDATHFMYRPDHERKE